MRSTSISIVAGVGLLTASMSPSAMAQVLYAPATQPSFFGFFDQPYDDSYDTHPSYRILRDTGRGPVVRVVHRCAYLGGWNVGDDNRELNGIPLGADHDCSAGALRERY